MSERPPFRPHARCFRSAVGTFPHEGGRLENKGLSESLRSHPNGGAIVNFVLIEPSIWQLSERIDFSRKSRLLETPFLEIVDRLVASARWTRCLQKSLDARPDYVRAELELMFPTDLVDLFHNGAGGYRAQFYSDMRRGEHANRYVIDSLIAKLKQMPIPKGEQDCAWGFLEASIHDADAKIWICEDGAWFRDKSDQARNLSVFRWMQNARRIEIEKNFKLRHPYLTPNDECRLEIKGGALDDRWVGGTTLKPSRSEDIHDLGFT